MEGRQRGLCPATSRAWLSLPLLPSSPALRIESLTCSQSPAPLISGSAPWLFTQSQTSPRPMSTACFQTAVAIMGGFEQFGLGHTCHFLSSGWSIGMHVQDGLAGIYVLSHLLSVHSVNHSGSAFTVIRSSSRASVPKTICSPPCHLLSLLRFKGKAEKISATPGSITTAS